MATDAHDANAVKRAAHQKPSGDCPRATHVARRGFTLIELMIGIVVGLIVIAGTIAVFMTVLTGANHTIRETRLNQELRVAMNFMVDDLRRAGFWREAGEVDFGAGGMPAHPNPFADRVGWDGRPVRDIFINADRDCILFSYNATFDPGSPPQEVFGYRLAAGAVDMLTGMLPATDLAICTNEAGVWTTLTDNVVDVVSLSFDTVGSTCFNGSDNTNWDVTSTDELALPACDPNNSDPVPSSGNVLIDSRIINVELEAQHSQNPATALTLSETVKVRNNRVHIAP